MDFIEYPTSQDFEYVLIMGWQGFQDTWEFSKNYKTFLGTHVSSIYTPVFTQQEVSYM